MEKAETLKLVTGKIFEERHFIEMAEAENLVN